MPLPQAVHQLTGSPGFWADYLFLEDGPAARGSVRQDQLSSRRGTARQAGVGGLNMPVKTHRSALAAVRLGGGMALASGGF